MLATTVDETDPPIMSQNSEMTTQSHNQENTSPEGLGVAKILRSSGARLFKSHHPKKKPLQEHSADGKGQGENSGFHKVRIPRPCRSVRIKQFDVRQHKFSAPRWDLSGFNQ